MNQFNKLCCGRRRYDPDLARRVKPVTLEIYTKALAKLLEYLDECRLSPVGAESLDEALTHYKQDRALTKSNFIDAVAEVEFFCPRFKRQLVVSRAVLEGMQVHRPAKHKVPMTKHPAVLFACHFAHDRLPRLGAALVIQTASGTRPSEVLKLRPEHVLFHDFLKGPCATLRLGAQVGTKSGREETAPVHALEEPEAYELLCSLVAATPHGSPLFPFSFAFYNRKIRELSRQLNVGVECSGHSPRAGFASERVARRESRPDVQARGRWKTPSSFLIYVDVILAAQVEVDFKLKGLHAAAEHCLAHWQDYFFAEAFADGHGCEPGAITSSKEAIKHTRGSRWIAASAPAGKADCTVVEASSEAAALASRSRPVFQHGGPGAASSGQSSSQGIGGQGSSEQPATAVSHTAAPRRPSATAKTRVKPPYRKGA